ncbi:MAG TPA: 50S ribosomal protein L29 [Verrucomicrobiae bacterium]|nr:50S ribosomal protein L29 [Verrucomicrobiae bacterium]
MPAESMQKFREMDANELGIQENELGEQIFRLRFQLTTGQAESVKKLREARKDLARVKTLMRQQELGIAAPAPAVEAGEGNAEAKPAKAAPKKKKKPAAKAKKSKSKK